MSDDEYFGRSFLDTFDDSDGNLYGTTQTPDVYEPLSVYKSSLEITQDYFLSAIGQQARAEQKRIERALRGAIRAGYDGVDINRPDPIDGVGIVSIIPWHRPEPDGANGYRTERYTWDWFSNDELTAILAADNPMAVLQEHD